ncbi:GNAT family N-acetyltransferase [Marinomonas transparens]|uniref:Aminoglycoside N(6')-acetyltransferase type 1 n=1 Tax=Marinomonas transparens TaxID=2795388 RepID=A0A934JND9_9GAMM|nr:GNAT family N-acetyltransferase [Marinomonas transparens]MBJ7537643.1 GNAT family N-acetyltransferase [Marinomonas transparens]
MKIRQVIKVDTEEWSQMRTALWPDTKDGHRAEIEEYFAGTSIDIEKAYVAELEDDIIGFLELNIRNFAEGSRKRNVPYVEAWYIKPKYQNQGYGRHLMRQAEQWAVSLGYSELASDTTIDNGKSIAMHKRLGFMETERVVCFLKSLKNRGV